MRCFCDVNGMLDSILHRVAWQADADTILAADRARRIVVCLSSLTLANFHHTARKYIGNVPISQAASDLARTCAILPVDQATFQMADALSSPDFEDDLQLTCAIQAKVDAIVPRGPRGFSHSPIRVLTPANLVAQLSGSSTP